MISFDEKNLAKLYKPSQSSVKHDNGSLLVIGGSSLFHGAPLLALKAVSRMVDMAFFASMEPSLLDVVAKTKASLFSFIWVPWAEVEEYIKRADAVLIGPGLMRYGKEIKKAKCKSQTLPAGRQDCKSKSKIIDEVGERTKKTTEELLKKFPKKRWVIDGGSLQVMEAKYIPEGTILTPNIREFKTLFSEVYGHCGEEECFRDDKRAEKMAQEAAGKYKCLIVLKTAKCYVASADEVIVVTGGNAGLTKGGTGDVLAGTIAGLLTKNEPMLAATAGSFLVKKAADELYKEKGFAYNADDLANKVAETYGEWWR